MTIYLGRTCDLPANAIGVIRPMAWPSLETLLGAGIVIAASIYTVRREAIRGRQLARASDGRDYSN